MTSPLIVIIALLASLGGARDAAADSDLCTFGWQRDVHRWLSTPLKMPEIFCAKDRGKARKAAEKAVDPLAKALTKDGYHITAGPHVHEIELTKDPSFELTGAIYESKCPKKNLKVVYAVCVSLQESAPNEFQGGKPVPKPDPRKLAPAPPRRPTVVPAI